MEQQKKTGQLIIRAIFFLAALLVCARQTANHIRSEFNNALQRIQNAAYLVSNSEKNSQINTQMLKELEENTAFDAIRFTNAKGVNLASDGKASDSSDRNAGCRDTAALRLWESPGLPENP